MFLQLHQLFIRFFLYRPGIIIVLLRTAGQMCASKILDDDKPAGAGDVHVLFELSAILWGSCCLPLCEDMCVAVMLTSNIVINF